MAVVAVCWCRIASFERLRREFEKTCNPLILFKASRRSRRFPREPTPERILKALDEIAGPLEGPIVFTPFEEHGARGYRFRGSAVLTGVVEEVAQVVRLSSPKYGDAASPPGFEP